MSTKVYDANEVSVMFAGRPIAFGEGSGLADGEFLKVEFTSDAFTSIAGSDGEVTRSKTNDMRAKVTISLGQMSDGNQVLSAIHNLDLLGPNGAGIGALLINDRNGNTILSADAAWIMKFPNVTRDRQSTKNEWVLEASKLKAFIGS